LRFLAIWILLSRNEDGRGALIDHATQIETCKQYPAPEAALARAAGGRG
jgi:hypothetical protein